MLRMIFHNIHHAESWRLVNNTLVSQDPETEILDWFGDIESRNAWLGKFPTVSPCVFPSIWVKVPTYQAPEILVDWLERPRAQDEMEYWEDANFVETFSGEFIQIPEHWEMIVNQEDPSWEDVLARCRSYQERAELSSK